jgi:hypothetical protein
MPIAELFTVATFPRVKTGDERTFEVAAIMFPALSAMIEP